MIKPANMPDSVWTKIQNLRNLAQNAATVGEAAAAAQALGKTLAKWNLTEADIPVGGFGGRAAEEASLDDDPLCIVPRTIPDWLARLLLGLGSQHDCQIIILQEGAGRVVKVVGTPTDVTCLRENFALYRTQITRLSMREAQKGAAWRDSFCRGAADAILAALLEARSEARSQASSTALAVVDGRAKAAAAEMERRFPHRGRASTSRGGHNAAGYAAGHAAGSNLGAGRSQIGGGSAGRLGS